MSSLRGVEAEDRDLIEPRLDFALGDFFVAVFQEHLLDEGDVGGELGGCAVRAGRRRAGDLDGRGLLQSPADDTEEAAVRLEFAVGSDLFGELRPVAAILVDAGVEPLAGRRLAAGDAERIGEHAARFEVRIDRRAAEPLAGFGGDLGRHEGMAVAVAAHPRAELDHGRNRDLGIGIIRRQRAAECRRALWASCSTAPAGTTGRGALRASRWAAWGG